MKSPRISIYGAIFVSFLAGTCLVLAQSATAVSPTPSATSTGPLYFASELPNALAIITRSLENSLFAQRHGLVVNASAQNQPTAAQPLEIIGPLPVYDIGNLNAADNLRTMAAPTLYNYFVENGGKQVAVVTMLMRRGGPVAAGTDYAAEEPNAVTLKTLAALDQIRSGSYEVRYVRVQFYGLNAIWLKPLHDGIDYVYVAPYGLYGMSGEHKEIQPDKLYTLDDFIKLLRPIIQQYFAPKLLDSKGFG